MAQPQTLSIIELGPEIRLLLACARTKLAAPDAARIKQQLQHPLDWSRLLDLAGQHQLTPLLHQNLMATAPQLVPDGVRTQLKERYYADRLRNRFRIRELARVLSLLAAGDIPAVAYKGPVLAAAAYGNVALRQFQDLDILVHPRDRRRAKALLEAHSYRQNDHLTGSRQGAEHAYKLVHPHNDIIVELHWQIVPKYITFPLRFEQLWSRRTSLEVAGHSLCTFSPEDTLLILCIHSHRHNWRQLRWLCDIAELCRMYRKTLEWDRILAQAKTLGCRRVLLLGLALSNDLLDLSLPPPVRLALQADGAVSGLALEARRRLLAIAPDDGLDAYFFPIKSRERWRDKLPYLVQLGRNKLAPANEAGAHGPTSRPDRPSTRFYRMISLTRKYGDRFLAQLFRTFLR